MMKKWLLLFISLALVLGFTPSRVSAANCQKKFQVDFKYSDLKEKESKRKIEERIHKVYNNTCRFLEKQAKHKNIKEANLKRYFVASDSNAKLLSKESSAGFYVAWGWDGEKGFYTPPGTIVINELRIDDRVISHETIHAFQGDSPTVHGSNMVMEGLTEYFATQLYATSNVAYHYAVKAIKAFSQAVDRLGKDGDGELVQALLDNMMGTRVNELIYWQKYKPDDSGDAKTTWQYIQFNLLIEAGERKAVPRKNHADLIGWLNGIGKAAVAPNLSNLAVTSARSGDQVTLTIKNIPATATKIAIEKDNERITAQQIDPQKQPITITIPKAATTSQTYHALAFSGSGVKVGEGQTTVAAATPPPITPTTPTTSTTTNPPTSPQPSGGGGPSQNGGGRQSRTGDKVSVYSPDFGKTFTNIGDYLAEVLKWAARIGTLAAVLVIVFAGNQIITSGGNPEKVNDAKEMIAGAILGLVVIFLLGWFISFFVDVGQFR